MIATFQPSIAQGVVAAPPSKSIAHRLLICAGLSQGESLIENVSLSGDISATLDCLRALGAAVEVRGPDVRVTGTDVQKALPCKELQCRESGSTLRFFIPICLLSGNRVVLRGSEALFRRPLEAYEDICAKLGLGFNKSSDSLSVQGPLVGGEYSVSVAESSQFVSGLLFALPLSDRDSLIRLQPPVESRPYIDLTVKALSQFGVEVEWTDDNSICVRGNQQYGPACVRVEGDYSNAAFFQALDHLGGDVTVTGLDPKSRQGDRRCAELFKLLEKGPSTIGISDCPDLGPILMAVAADLHGATLIGTRRLRLKESDRALAMQKELYKFGAKVDVEENRVTVFPSSLHAPDAMLDGHNDHRIVMALAVLAAKYGGRISGAEAVAKSLPDFFDRMKTLGVRVHTDTGA